MSRSSKLVLLFLSLTLRQVTEKTNSIKLMTTSLRSYDNNQWHLFQDVTLYLCWFMKASIAASPTGEAVILVIMHVKIFKTGVIVFIVDAKMCFSSPWPIISNIRVSSCACELRTDLIFLSIKVSSVIQTLSAQGHLCYNTYLYDWKRNSMTCFIISAFLNSNILSRWQTN
jgi:hypothetical protein